MRVIASLRYCASVMVFPVRVAIVILLSSETKRSLYILNSEGGILASLVSFNFTAGRRLPVILALHSGENIAQVFCFHSVGSGFALFYEMLCHHLLRSLQVPTPELALVEISEDSFRKEQLSYNKKHCKIGQLYLGSREVPNAELLQSIAIISGKSDFNKLANPYDLFRMAMFDLWVNNVDRGRNQNYNLLEQNTEEGIKFYAFDHAFCFGGVGMLRAFNPAHPIDTGDRLITSLYFKSILPYLDKQTCMEIIDNFLTLSPDEIDNCIEAAFAGCPAQWAIPRSLLARSGEFLSDQGRINVIRNIMVQQLI